MKDKSFEEKVHSIDWTIYLKPKYYDSTKMEYKPNDVIKALIELNRFNESNTNGISLGSQTRFAIGNDHRGTYYPAALKAIDLIIEIEKYSEIEAARKCAFAVLNDLHYFQLEMPDNDENLYEAIDTQIKEKLELYSDQNMAN